MLTWLTTKVLFAYIASTSIFLILRLFSRFVSKESSSFLDLANLIALVILTLNLILLGVDSIACMNEQTEQIGSNRTESYDFAMLGRIWC
jgi:hypothetical protein